MSLLRDFAKGLRMGMRYFGESLNALINSALLLIVYVVAVGGTSLVAKLFGKHFFEKNISKKQDTYWLSVENKKEESDLYRQF